MKIEVHNSCTDFDSYRAARVKSLFNAESGANFDLSADLPIDDPNWQLGLIVGPSGSGKTSMGLRLLAQTLEDIERGVLVQIPQDSMLATWEPSLNPPPLTRPDLPMLTDGSDDGYRRIVSREDLGWNASRCAAALGKG